MEKKLGKSLLTALEDEEESTSKQILIEIYQTFINLLSPKIGKYVMSAFHASPLNGKSLRLLYSVLKKTTRLLMILTITYQQIS